MAHELQTAAVSSSRKPVVAICLRHYLPGYKSGGPVRTIANLVEHLGDEFDFRIVTSDRDVHDREPYSRVAVDAWQQLGKSRVFYASPAMQTLGGMAHTLNAIDYDVLYVNSFFDPCFTILPLIARWLGMLRCRRVIVAPRGELADSALHIRAWKKMPFRLAARVIGLFSGVTWHASSQFERSDIGRRMGLRAAEATHVAVNLPKLCDAEHAEPWRPRASGEPLRLVFLARIAPMKNLDYALRVLATAGIPIAFDVYGMVDDEHYWEQCKKLIENMPRHVQVAYRGAVSPAQVGDVLAAHDAVFLPTRGENYGHVIAEALGQGTPVLISDRTPWRGLAEAGVGWDLPLQQSGHQFLAALESLAAMAPGAMAELRERTAKYGATVIGSRDSLEANRRLFAAAARQ